MITLVFEERTVIFEFLSCGVKPSSAQCLVQIQHLNQRNVNGITYASIRKDTRHNPEECKNIGCEIFLVEICHSAINGK